MDLHDFLNVRRVLRTLAKDWGVPVFVAKATIQRWLDEVWASAQGDPDAEAKLTRHFPAGQPTVAEYLRYLGHIHERGEDLPELS